MDAVTAALQTNTIDAYRALPSDVLYACMTKAYQENDECSSRVEGSTRILLRPDQMCMETYNYWQDRLHLIMKAVNERAFEQ